MSKAIKRTLGPAAFEAYMNFADSLKTPENSDQIDKFKYQFAVSEGYIKPEQPKAKLESVGGLGMAEEAVKGLLGAFLPHLNDEETTILGGFLEKFDEAVKTGKNPFASDDESGDESDDDDVDEDEVDEDESCEDGECPEGETCENGECKKDDSGEGEAITESIVDDDFPGAGFNVSGDGTEYSFSDDYPETEDEASIAAEPEGPDYDALADEILADNGFERMTKARGGIGKLNNKFWS
jgi:hypothetical protein